MCTVLSSESFEMRSIILQSSTTDVTWFHLSFAEFFSETLVFDSHFSSVHVDNTVMSLSQWMNVYVFWDKQYDVTDCISERMLVHVANFSVYSD